MPAILKVLSFALTCKSQSKQIMSVLRPINFQKWLDENRDLLKPPVANKNLTPDSDEYICMVVAGPNARKDYHYNETEELFYQLEGNITVNVQVDGKVESLDLGPGDILIAPLTDPSWTPLFVPAEAVVVNVGGQMSHAVIVSRELGMPCVVAVKDATEIIQDGTRIRVDGSTGEIMVLKTP